MKACKKCGVEKSLDEYYAIKGNKDGKSGKCKDCTKKDVQKNYRKNIDHYKEYDKKRAMLPHRVEARKAYLKTEAGKVSKSKTIKKYRENNPNKYKAHTIVGNAVRDGKLFKEPCEVCGAKKVHAHHDDYSKPLNIRWLCDKHHNEWHKENGEGKNP